MRPERIAVSLTGGLGNQLFQLAVGLFNVNELDEDLLLETGIGKPRLNESNFPEVASFNLPAKVKFTKYKNGSWLVRKSLGYVLRMGVAPRKIEKIDFVKNVILKLSSILSSIYFGGKRKVIYGKGLGYFDLKTPQEPQILIGYFQCDIWARTPGVYEKLMGITPVNKSDLFESFCLNAVEDRPLIVHVRRGDYESESDFGLLGPGYYADSIISQMETGKYKKIWLFSDGIDQALQLIPERYTTRIRTVPSTLSTSESLELMRHGVGYVIANSSFSWWGAFLSYTKDPIIVAPSPWFKGLKEPNRLIPETWQKKEAQFIN